MGQWIDFQQTFDRRLLVENLDDEQNRARNFNLKEHGLIRGVAGSGKSLLLKHRFEKLVQNNFENILVLSYNRFMNIWLNTKLAQYKPNTKINCLTFHQWAYRNFNYNYNSDQKDDERKELVNLAKKSSLNYQAIIVDEAQDFYDEWFSTLLEVLDPDTKSLFFVYDNTQSVYGQFPLRKADWTWKNLGIDVNRRSQIFDINYRNAPEIITLAWNFIEPQLIKQNIKFGSRSEVGGKINMIVKPKVKQSRSSGVKPLFLQIYEQKMPLAIAEQVKMALSSHPNSSIGILTHPQKTMQLKQEISYCLTQMGIKHHAPESSQDRKNNVVERPYVIVDSWNALKGVEFDAVIIAGVDKAKDLSFTEQAGVYVAMTRAKDHLIILYHSKTPTVELVESALLSTNCLESVD